MSYTVKQKIGKNIYAYEVVSYYDKEKKQPRQKRIYLGRVDPETNEIVQTDRMKASIPKSAKSFGLVHLLDHVGESIGLKKALAHAFPNEWKEMLSLSFFELSEGKPLYLFPQWLEDTYIPYLNKRDSISSQSISKLLKEIGERDAKIEQFFINWIPEVEDTSSVIFDITSISSYSNCIDTVEWGYNRDKENLPQINLGMVFGEPSSLPLFYSLYQGSIPDIVTLKNILLRLNSFGIKDTLFVMDRGFFSRHNIDMMCEDNIKFIIPMSQNKLSKELLLKHREDLSSPLNFFMHNGNIIFSVEEPIEIDKHKLYAFIYLDKQRELEETQRFLKGLAGVEREVKDHSFKDIDEAKEFIESYKKGISKYFIIRLNRGKVTLLRKEDEIVEEVNRMGKMIIVTNLENMDKEKVLFLYKRRNEVERLFDILKNDIDGNRIRNHSNETMEGKLFLLFITLILYAALDRVMVHKGLYKEQSLSNIIYELKKLKVVETNNGKRFLTEISKTQKTIYKEFEVPIPEVT